MFRERAESAIPFNPPTHRVPRSSTASDIVNTRRSSPLDRRIPFASSPLKHSNSPYRSRTQNQASSHLWRSSPHRPLACLPSDSEVSNEFGADSDDYFADDGRSSTESTIQRLRKALEEKENIVQEQDQTIRDLRNKFLGAEAKILDLKDELQRTRNTAQDLGRALDRRSEAQTSLEDYSDMLKKDNIKLGNLVNSLRQENYELVRKAYTYSVPSTPWHWLDIDPYMKLFLQDACHSDFYKELLLATRGDLAKKILDALHTVRNHVASP